MRVIQEVGQLAKHYGRITPARAGKTDFGELVGGLTEDHPRACG